MENKYLICITRYSNIKPNTICCIDNSYEDDKLFLINQMDNTDSVEDNRPATILKSDLYKYFTNTLSVLEILNILDSNLDTIFNIAFMNRNSHNQIHLKSPFGFVMMSLHSCNDVFDYMNMTIKLYLSDDTINENNIILTHTQIERVCEYIKNLFNGGGTVDNKQ